MKEMTAKETRELISTMSQKDLMMEVKRYANRHDNIASNQRMIAIVKALDNKSVVDLFHTLAVEEVLFILGDMVELLEDDVVLLKQLYQVKGLDDFLKCQIGLRIIKLEDYSILEVLCRHLIIPEYAYSLVQMLKERGKEDKIELISYRAFLSNEIDPFGDNEMLLELLNEIRNPKMLLDIAKGNNTLEIKQKAFLQLPARYQIRNQKLKNDL